MNVRPIQLAVYLNQMLVNAECNGDLILSKLLRRIHLEYVAACYQQSALKWVGELVTYLETRLKQSPSLP